MFRHAFGEYNVAATSVSIFGAAYRRMAASCFCALLLACLGLPALAQTARNQASVAPPSGVLNAGASCTAPRVFDPASGTCTATDADSVVSSADLTVAKTQRAGTTDPFTSSVLTVPTGRLVQFQIVVGNNGPSTVAGAVFSDPVPTNFTALSLVSVTPAAGATACTAAFSGNTLSGSFSGPVGATCTAIVQGTTTTATVATGVMNIATATPPDGVTDPTPARSLVNTVIQQVPAVDFCAANTVFNIGQLAGPPQSAAFFRYTLGGSEAAVPELNFNVPSDLNALMVDPVRKRLLFLSRSGGAVSLYAYDPANGGWYRAAGPQLPSVDFPRGGMNASGVGYLVGSGNTPQVWRIEASGAFNYTFTSIGTLAYDFAPVNPNSGDVAFDSAGNGWLVTGPDVYKIDFNATPLVAVRQQRPLLNGSPSTLVWAGAAFGTDGRLYVANNGAGGRYYALDLATAVLTPAASTSTNQSRDLASCAFPPPPSPAQLQVVKTLAQVNGSPYTPGQSVQQGDTLSYAIAISHVGGTTAATLFPGEVVETLPANTTYVSAGNDFTCSGSTCPNANAINIAVGGSATLNFVVQVNNPLPAGVGPIVNAVAVQGVDCTAAPNDCTESTPVREAADVSVAKTLTTAGPYVAGQTVSFDMVVGNAGPATATNVQVTDTPSNFTIATVTGACSALPCTIGSIAAGGQATITVTGVIQAEGAFGNTASANTPDQFDPNPGNNTGGDTGSTTPVADVSVTKTLTTAGPYIAGQTVSFDIIVGNAGPAAATNVQVTDTPSNFTIATVTGACSALPCTIASIAAGGQVAITVTGVIQAEGAFGNTATANTSDQVDPNPGNNTGGDTGSTTPVADVSVTKTLTTAGPYIAGQTVSFDIIVSNAGPATATNVQVTDTPSNFAIATVSGACSALPCTIASIAAGGQTAITVTGLIQAEGAFGNTATANTPDQVDANPGNNTGGDSGSTTPVADVSVTKILTTASPYVAGQTVGFDIIVSNAGPATATNVQVTDTPSNFAIAAVTGACRALPCTIGSIAAGTQDTITVTGVIQAEGAFGNTASANTPDQVDPNPGNNTGGDTGNALPPSINAVEDDHSGTPVDGNRGGTLPSVLNNDTLNGQPIAAGAVVLTPGASPNPGLAMQPDGSIVVAPGTQAGTYQYPYTICDAARPTICDTAIATIVVQGSGGSIRITKTASSRDARPGDLVRYTVTLQNLSNAPIVDATVVDTPPAGFSYVADSLAVADANGAGRLAGTAPIRVDQIDIATGGRATLNYLLRVGAGVRPGVHVNSAYAIDNGVAASNTATAQVRLVGDPLLQDSLILGTVFDDRDGDGWQDSAALSGLHVQGGFAAHAYAANSTTVDYGHGPQPQADASAPLLHGIALGGLPGRQSEAEPVAAHRIVVSQTLTALAFTDDFVLTSKQGVRVRMDAAGNTRVEGGDGRSSAAPTVERRIAQIDGGYRVDYVIGNAGIDERGIPGVRVASVEGLLMETDQFGRYHLAGMDGGRWERGRNVILKVDPATLPPGSTLTTPNPLLRRVTPGLPVRFDFGVKLPSGVLPAPQERIEMEIGEVLFQPGSAQLQAQAAAAIERMAEEVRKRDGGEVVIAANGETQALAYDRAKTVRDALLQALGAARAQQLSVSLRTDPADPATGMVSLGEAPLLGTLLFDTGQAAIKPEYVPLIEKIAADIDAMGGGAVEVAGHADRRGSDAANMALGLRRAKAVQQAIAARLGPAARAKLRVEISNAAPVGMHGR